LLFGANKLPELAKSLGQARKEFKKGMLEAEREEQAEVKPKAAPKSAASLSQLNDDEILAEIQRRQAKQLEQNVSN
jgi:Sec-independent protein translocase protein TatA